MTPREETLLRVVMWSLAFAFLDGGTVLVLGLGVWQYRKGRRR